MAHSWLGTTDSLSLTQLANEQINSQSQTCCLTSRPLPLQDNCLDYALCLRECLYRRTKRTGEACEARKPQGPRARAGIASATLQRLWVHSLTDGREHWSPSLNRSLPSLKRKLQTSACFTHGILNIDHGELNPRSHGEGEAKSAAGEAGRGTEHILRETGKHSSTGGQPSEDRKSAPPLTCQPRRFLQDSTAGLVLVSSPPSALSQHS